MNNELYIINKFFEDSNLIVHKGTGVKIGKCPFIFLTFNVGDILEFKDQSLNRGRLRNSKGHLTDFLAEVPCNQPFKVISKIENLEISLIRIKYITQLELFDIIYNIDE
jgi:hypothetical protein